MAVFDSVLDMIGNTPIVDCSALSPNPDVRILGKMEGQNPAGSVKDRIALAMVEEAEADGTLTPGKRSEERRVGKESVSKCRSRRSPSHYKKKTNIDCVKISDKE